MSEKVKGWKLFKCDSTGRIYCQPDTERFYFEVGKKYSVEVELKWKITN